MNDEEKSKKAIRDGMLETIDNQIKANDPPETKQTYL